MEKNSGCMIMSLASMAFIDLVLFLFDVNAGLLFLAIAAVSIIFAFIANLIQIKLATTLADTTQQRLNGVENLLIYFIKILSIKSCSSLMRTIAKFTIFVLFLSLSFV